MRIRFLLTLVGLAISFAWPALAQEKAATPAVPNPFQPIPAGPSLVQQVEAINEKFDEAFNKHDATAVAAFYTENAILSSPLGNASGLPEIEKHFTNLFERYSPTDRSTKMNYVFAFGGDICAMGGWTVTINGHQQAGGYLINVYTPMHKTWKIRAVVFKYATGP
jgi:ketosteroid isomerase-like protein